MQVPSYPLVLIRAVLGYDPQCPGNTWTYSSGVPYTRTTTFPSPSYSALSTMVGIGVHHRSWIPVEGRIRKMRVVVFVTRFGYVGTGWPYSGMSWVSRA
jgi:hypothetical protein